MEDVIISVNCWEVSQWEWSGYIPIRNGLAVVKEGALIIDAPAAGDGVSFDFTVTANVPQELQLQPQRLISSKGGYVQIMEQQNGKWVSLGEATIRDGSTMTIPFTPKGSSVKVYFWGPANMYYAKWCFKKKEWVEQDELVTICSEDKDKYRWGYGTQEKVNEWSGIGNHYTAKFWEYDTRTGRRLNLDPKVNHSLSPYATFDLTPIWKNDVLGNKPDIVFKGTDNKEVRIKTKGKDIVENVPVKLGKNRTIDLGLGKVDPNNFAYGYTIQVDGQASAEVGGKVGAELTVAQFSDPKYSNYNYVYAGGHTAVSYGIQNGASASAGVSLFVAYNTDYRVGKHNPKSFSGPFYSMALSADLKNVVGGGWSLSAFSSTKEPLGTGWKGLSLGISVGFGADEKLSISKQTSTTILLNDVIPTSKRGWIDKISNSAFPIKSSFIQYAMRKLKGK